MNNPHGCLFYRRKVTKRSPAVGPPEGHPPEAGHLGGLATEWPPPLAQISPQAWGPSGPQAHACLQNKLSADPADTPGQSLVGRCWPGLAPSCLPCPAPRASQLGRGSCRGAGWGRRTRGDPGDHAVLDPGPEDTRQGPDGRVTAPGPKTHDRSNLEASRAPPEASESGLLPLPAPGPTFPTTSRPSIQVATSASPLPGLQIGWTSCAVSGVRTPSGHRSLHRHVSPQPESPGSCSAPVPSGPGSSVRSKDTLTVVGRRQPTRNSRPPAPRGCGSLRTGVSEDRPRGRSRDS